MDLLIRMNANGLLRAALSNMDMVLAKADMGLAERYTELVPDRLSLRNIRHFGRGMRRTTKTLDEIQAHRASGRQPGARPLDSGIAFLYSAP